MKKGILIFCCLSFFFTSFSQDFEWAKSFGCNLSHDDARAAVVDAQGNIYLAGGFGATTDFDTNPTNEFYITSMGGGDAYIMKLSPAGDLVWIKTFGASQSEFNVSIAIDPNGDLFVLGSFKGTVDLDFGTGISEFTATNDAMFITKLSTDGSYYWTKIIQGIAFNYFNYPPKLKIDPQGNIVVVGNFQGTVDFDPGTSIVPKTAVGLNDIYFLKLTNLGDFSFVKTLGSSGNEYGVDFDLDFYGNIYATGVFSGVVDFDPDVNTSNITSNGEQDVFFIKLDSIGNLAWANQLGGPQADYVSSLDVDFDNNVILTGGFSISADFDPGISEYYISATINPYSNAYMLKLNENAAFVWAKTISYYNTDFIPSCVKTDEVGNLFLTGDFEYIVDVDPNAGVFNLHSSGQGTSEDIFLLKLDQSGNFMWAHGFGNEYVYDGGLNILTSSNNELFLLGAYNYPVDFDPGPDTTTLVSTGGTDAFILKLSDWKNSISELDSEQQQVVLYPNPTVDKLTIHTEMNVFDSEFEIKNILGQELMQGKLKEFDTEIDLATFPSGTYLIGIGKSNQVLKFVKL